MNQINLDPTDQASMNMMMDEHGDSKTMYPGTNEYGEDVYISIFHDKIVTSTTQSKSCLCFFVSLDASIPAVSLGSSIPVLLPNPKYFAYFAKLSIPISSPTL